MKNILFALLLLFYVSYGETLTIAAAANVQYALKEITQEFQKKYPAVRITKIISSSGKLTAQIVRGAPYDLLLSADMKYPEFLYKKGFAISKPVVYAKGTLVLWSMKDIPLENEIKSLLNPSIKKIAIPDPKTAPYGREAKKALEKSGIYPKVRYKLVYGESVGQATQYIYKGLVDVGFTAKSVVLSPQMKNKGRWIEIDNSLYSSIKQGIVILKHGEKNLYAQKFIEFLLSDTGKKILKKYGYQIDE
ncbi:molybdate ABC transporter substrate-binding protein [Persephonella sp. KM09-Lau-8]|uniref:molybdate ABC transporter substrate-binding protein n=1 Tax=Persephonella sp. KM09-Lau-8 TaxID=1158345 RepID=UPI0004980A59|nr:molybdate ABC transporter substrate-binding protein [Persephonella sp. KM09-Lau-8]